jgi:hypothetical protein
MGESVVPTEPAIDEGRIKRIYAELSKLGVSLDADPLALGPKRMQHKVASVRHEIKRCVDIELQLSEDLHWFTRALTREQGHYDLEFQNLIAHDPHVRAGRNIQDREAVAKVRLKERWTATRALEESVSDLDALLVVVRIKARDLRSTMARLKDQLKLCEHELGLGAKWGHSRPSVFDGEPQATAADTKDIEDLLEAADAEVAESTNTAFTVSEEDAEANEEALPGSASGEAADTFLDSLGNLDTSNENTQEPPTPDGDDDDVNIDGLLAGLD